MNQNNNMPADLTVEDAIISADETFSKAGLYYGHGTDNSWDEAAWLVAHVIRARDGELSGLAGRYLSDEERHRLKQLVDERCDSRTPMAYLLNEAFFGGLPFYLDERALVPRSYFAEWIDEAFSPWIDMSTVNTVLELGTGSGCIAITLAKHFPHCRVDASDLSAAALEVAAINVRKHGVQNQVHLHHSDLFKNLPAGPFDLIVSNPPYVTEATMCMLPAEYRKEPAMALQADENGTAIIDAILRQAGNFLGDKGHLIIEVASAAGAIESRYPGIAFTWLSVSNGDCPLLLIGRDELQRYREKLNPESSQQKFPGEKS